MKYDIDYSCGHSGVIELFGKVSERERKLKWLAEEGMYPECHKSYLREVNDDRVRRALDAIGDIALPQLTGKSEKQLSYAESERAKYILNHTNNIKWLYAVIHMDDDKRAEVTAKLAASGKSYEEAYANTLAKFPNTTAILTETDAGKLLDVLKSSSVDLRVMSEVHV